MVMLHMLQALPNIQIIVAHFDHGIREESADDRSLVEVTAKRYGLPFEYAEGKLGAKASEAQARDARYAFLRNVKARHHADAIITAHHEDDVIETAILNMLRGTGRKGLSSLGSQPDIIRPFLRFSKKELHEYARKHPEIVWHTDATNFNDQYLRNYVRLHILKDIDDKTRERLLEYIRQAQEINPLIDDMIKDDLSDHSTSVGVDRRWFISLPYDVSCEVMASWLRELGLRDFTSQTISRLVVAAKVALPGKAVDINAGYRLEMKQGTLQITVALS